MARKFQIKLEEKVFHQLKELCKGDENVMHDYIVHILKENLNQSNCNFSPEEKDDLEGYLKKGLSGSRNYGVKGQGW